MSFLDSILKRRLIGLDIGVSGIKAVELSGGGGGLRLMAYNRVTLPWDTITPEGEIKQRNVLVVALRSLFEKGFSGKNVAVSAFGNSIMTKKISVPRMSERELSEQLYWEAEQYIPFNISDVNLDFAILDGVTGTQASATPMMDVLLVAAKKDYVHSLVGAVEEAGLKPVVVDSQAFALGNAFEHNYSHLLDMTPGGATSVIVDFGAGTTKVSMVEGDKTVFTRDLRQCGIACTAALSERLGIPFEEAEQAKIAEAETEAVRGVLGEFNAAWVEEISRTIDFCVSQNADRAVQGVYICGGASQTYGLVEEMEARMPAPVQFFNPVQNIVGSGRKMNADSIRELALVGSVAIGLAMRTAGDSK